MKSIHERALMAAKNFKTSEAELIEVLGKWKQEDFICSIETARIYTIISLKL